MSRHWTRAVPERVAGRVAAYVAGVVTVLVARWVPCVAWLRSWLFGGESTVEQSCLFGGGGNGRLSERMGCLVSNPMLACVCRRLVSVSGRFVAREQWTALGRRWLVLLLFCVSVYGVGGGDAQVWGYQTGEAPQLTRLFPAGARRGATTEIQIKGKYQADSVRVWSHRAGVAWEKLTGEESFAVSIDAEAEVGVVWVRLVDASGASEVMPFVVSDWPELNEVEPNDRSDAAQPVADMPLVINGVLQKGGDVDHFRVSVAGGQTLVATVDAQRYLQSAVDATLQLVSLDGQLLMQNMDYRGLDPQIVWTAPQDGEVVLRVFGFPAAPDSTISLGGGERFIYRLSVTTGEAVEAVSPLALERGVTTEVQRHGWNLPEGAKHTLTWPSDPSAECVLAWPMALGVFRLPVVEHPSRLASELRISEPSAAASQSEEGLPGVTLPVTITGNLTEPRQVDRFLLDVPAEKTWRVQVAARELGYAWDPVIEIYSVSDGKRLQRQDDQGTEVDPVWDWTPPAAGQYWLQVFDLHGHARAHAWYRLSVTERLPDVRLHVAGTVYRGKVGEPLEIKVDVERLQGYAIEMELGLATQEGAETIKPVTCEVQRSSVADESGKQVVLRLQSAEPFQGPIRLIAREVTGEERTYTVRAKTAGLADLWVSFLP